MLAKPVTPELYPSIIAALKAQRSAKHVALAFSIGESRARRIAKLENIDLVPRGTYARERKHRDATSRNARTRHKDAAYVAALRAGTKRFYADPECRESHSRAASKAAYKRWTYERAALAAERKAALAEHKAWVRSRRRRKPSLAPTTQAQALRALKLRQQNRREGGKIPDSGKNLTRTDK